MRPDILVFFDGEQYALRPSIKALIRVEDELGQPISAIGSQIGVKTATLFIKHTIRKADGTYRQLTPQEWDHVLEVATLDELIGGVIQIVKEIAPTKAISTMNDGGEDTKN